MWVILPASGTAIRANCGRTRREPGFASGMRYRRQAIIAGILVPAIVLAALPATAAAATTPTVHELATPTGYVSAVAAAVNNLGIAVGYATDAAFGTIAVKWNHSGSVTSLGTLPGDDFSAALGINDRGQIAGYSGNSTAGTDHAVEWNAQGAITDLGASPGQITDSEAHAINDRGEVVGSDQTAPRIITATRWSANGTIDNFGLADIDTVGDTTVSAVNDRGEMAGYQFVIHGRPSPIRWNADASYLQLPVLPDARGGGGQANGINNLGITVGLSPTSAFHVFDAVSWDTKGDITDLGGLPGGIGSSANGINDPGVTVGSAGDANAVDHATTWSRTGSISALPDVSGGSNGEALAISDSGFIVGDDIDANGNQVAVLWR